MSDEWAKRFREALKDSGHTMKSASIEAGLNDSFVRDMLERGRVPSIDKFQKLARVVGKTVSWLLGDEQQPQFSSMVPLMGFVGAGAEVEPEFEQIPPEGLDQIEVPFPLPPDMIALQVRGDSMLPVYKDGSIIIVHREQKRPLQAFYGREAAVRTSDGRRFIKTIMRGAKGVNLISWNAQPIENVHLEWIGEIFAVFPPTSIRHLSNWTGIDAELKRA